MALSRANLGTREQDIAGTRLVATRGSQPYCLLWCRKELLLGSPDNYLRHLDTFKQYLRSVQGISQVSALLTNLPSALRSYLYAFCQDILGNNGKLAFIDFTIFEKNNSVKSTCPLAPWPRRH